MEEVTCSHCGKEYLRPSKRIREAIKFGWKQYCSPDCQFKAKTKTKEFKCGNPQCNKTFFRTPHEIPVSEICFCSNSCAAKITNIGRKITRKKPISELNYVKK